MTRKGSDKKVTIRFLMYLPLLAAMMVSLPGCSQTGKPADSGMEVAPPPPPPPTAIDKSGSQAPLEVVDVLPVFKGGDAELIKFISENVRYPESSKKKGIQGKVLVRFAIEKDGSVDRVSILEAVDPELDQEAIRVVSALPKFEKPALKNGNEVPVWYVLPINFALK